MKRLRLTATLFAATLVCATWATAQPAGDATADASDTPAPSGSDDSASSEETATDAAAEGEPERMAPLSETLHGMAKAEYEAARILYQDGDYQGALTKLKVAYQQAKDPRLLWNMAAAEKNLRHYARVIELMDEYLAAGEPYITPADEEQARTLVDTVRGFVSTVTVRAKPDGALVSVDGAPVGNAPLPGPLSLDFGSRTFRVTLSGYEPWSQQVELKGGETHQLDVSLVREINEGQLKIVSDSNATIRVDGAVVGVGLWEGQLLAGAHTVQIEAPGKIPTTTEVVVAKGEARIVNQPLRDEVVAKKKLPAWAWITGGVVTAAAVGAGTYFAVRGNESTPAPEPGTWGTLEF